MREIIGVDFDNTIICYDNVFNSVGIEKGLIPESLPVGKGYVRDYLRANGREAEWVWLQGYVYGTRLSEASLYEGVREFFHYCRLTNIDCYIISHKTVFPYSGEKYNLHKAAKKWIEDWLLDVTVFFEISKEDKVKRISEVGCTVFVDDLPEFLSLEGFPERTVKILFDPSKENKHHGSTFQYATCWDDILMKVKNRNDSNCIP